MKEVKKRHESLMSELNQELGETRQQINEHEFAND